MLKKKLTEDITVDAWTFEDGYTGIAIGAHHKGDKTSTIVGSLEIDEGTGKKRLVIFKENMSRLGFELVQE